MSAPGIPGHLSIEMYEGKALLAMWFDEGNYTGMELTPELVVEIVGGFNDIAIKFPDRGFKVYEESR